MRSGGTVVQTIYFETIHTGRRSVPPPHPFVERLSLHIDTAKFYADIIALSSPTTLEDTTVSVYHPLKTHQQ